MTAKASTPISTASGIVAIAAIAGYQVLLIVLIILRPDLDPSWHTISEWAYGRYGWMMSGAFLLSALSYGALFVMLLPYAKGALGRIGLGLLALCFVGAFWGGRMQDRPDTPSLAADGARRRACDIGNDATHAAAIRGALH